jgi:acyl-CoA synthetase (AMP-forming)/AMP-acid ligase II
VNLASFVDQHDAAGGALHDHGVWHPWGDVRARAAAVAAGLGRMGVRPDDRVAIVWPTSVDFVVAYLGALAAGAVAVPLNPLSPENELARELAVVEPKVVLAGASPQGAESVGPAAVTGAARTLGSAVVPVVIPGGTAGMAGAGPIPTRHWVTRSPRWIAATMTSPRCCSRRARRESHGRPCSPTGT